MYTTNDPEPTNVKITPNMNASSSTNGHNGNGMGGSVVVAINGNNAINGNGYKNGIAAITRRDSAQVLAPLLPPNDNDANSQSNNEHAKNDKITLGVDGGVLDNVENNSQTNNSTLYEAAPSNNNEWKDSEEINNLKNELLHHVNNHHHHQNQGNNNGSLINGKNGLGINEKYNEQDPLTGLYNGQNGALRVNESDESDFDSDLHAQGADSDNRKSPSCGLFGCRPKWARQLASTHVFMVVFLLAYILQGMYMTYFVSVITTIEKLFQIKSKTTGFLLSASEMGQISTALLLTYFAGRGHRPRWIACGMVVFSLAAFSCSLPHFIFGEQLMHASMVSNGGPATSFGNKDVGGLHINQTQTHADNVFVWPTDTNLCLATNATTNSECNEDRKLEQASQSKITSIVLCIFFVSLLSTGVGQTAVATLGIPYIDDNVASKQSPMYMAITIGVRILGPASGFIVGSLCSRLFVNLSNPGFSPGDPRWIGAWWLGPVMIGSLMMLASIAMFSFPKQLRGKRPANVSTTNESKSEAAVAEVDETPKLKDFPKTVRRQLSNDILMFRTASCVFHLLPIAGLYTFLPKYLETQFRLPTYDANMITAFCGILVMGVGIVVSGLVILKLKPSARSVAAWIAFTALFYSAGMLVLMFVGCNNDDFAGYKPSRGNTAAVIEPACSAALNCTCDRENFAPICGVDGRMYLSSCHAGCSMSELRASDNKTVYANCACIPDPINNDGAGATIVHEAVSGYCDTDCKNFIIFVLIFASCVFMHSTSEVGSMLLVMRCTHPKDKAMAMGIIQSAIGLFGNVPCPIIYGAVVDSACLIWKTVCGKHGACSLYDAASFRHYFLGMTTGIMFIAFIMDLIVWSKAHRIDIAPEDNANNAEDNDQGTVTASEYKKSLNENTANGTPDTSV